MVCAMPLYPADAPVAATCGAAVCANDAATDGCDAGVGIRAATAAIAGALGRGGASGVETC